MNTQETEQGNNYLMDFLMFILSILRILMISIVLTVLIKMWVDAELSPMQKLVLVSFMLSISSISIIISLLYYLLGILHGQLGELEMKQNCSKRAIFLLLVAVMTPTIMTILFFLVAGQGNLIEVKEAWIGLGIG